MSSKALEAAAEAMLHHDAGYCLGEHSVPERAAMQLAQAAISAYLSALAEDGWKLVPVEATEKMKAALMAKSPLNEMRCKLAWDAMIAAAPHFVEENISTPLTVKILADALECFWNAALGAQQNDMSPVSCIAEGVQAVAIRLKEHTKTIESKTSSHMG